MRRAWPCLIIFLALNLPSAALKARAQQPLPPAGKAAAAVEAGQRARRKGAAGGAATAAGGGSAPASSNAPAPGAGGARSPAPPPPSAPAKPANQAPSGPARELPIVVVTATRIETPLSQIGTTLSVIGDGQIQTQKIEQVADVLRQIPGVELTQSGSPGTTTSAPIRGATSAQTLVLIDGVEVNSGTTGAFDLADLTTDNLERIEVLRGAGGALYGSQAVGGVINLLSKEGEGAPRFRLLSEGGNRATQRQVTTFNGASGPLGYSGALSYSSTTGFRPINDSYDNLSGNLRLDYHAGERTVLRGFARYIRSNVSLVNASNFLAPIDPDAHQRGEFMLFKGELEHRLSDRLLVRWSGFFVRNDLRFFDLPDSGNPASDRFHAPDEIRGTTLEVLYEWLPGFRSLAGFDFKDRWARSGDSFAIAAFGFESITLFRAERQEYAGYIEQEATLLHGLLLATGGFRVDGNSDFGREVSPAWSVAIPVTKIATTLRGSYSEGFRAPSFNELSFPGFGNPNLQPEVSSEYDGGFTTVFGELASFTATYFSRRVKNLIVAVPCSTCEFGSQAGNAGRVDTQGVELVPALYLGREFSLSGNFTVIDQTHRSSSPTIRPLRVPKRAASGLAQYSRPDNLRSGDRLAASLAYTFFGDRDDLDPPSFTIRNHAAYHRFDAVVSYAPGLRRGRLRKEEIFVRVQNLFDRNYSEALGFKAPPVNFVAGVKLDF